MAGLLDGVTVLDLASVGPAVRASGWLADYGATVIKVAPVPRDAAAQLVPKAHYYSGGRGHPPSSDRPQSRRRTRRVPAAGRVRRRRHRELPARRRRPARHRLRRRQEREPRHRLLLDQRLRPDRRRAQWAGHDLNYLAVGGYLAGEEPTADGKPPIPGATIADSAGGGMQAVVAILAALVSRDRDRRRQLPRRRGRRRRPRADVAAGRRRPRDRHSTQLPGTAPLSGGTPATTPTACADDSWVAVAAIEAKFWANLCRALGLESLIDRQYDDDGAGRTSATALAAAFRTKPRDEWVAKLAAADTCVSPVLTATEAAADTAFASRDGFATARAGHRRGVAAARAAARRRRARDDTTTCPTVRSPTPTTYSPSCGFTADGDRAAARPRSCRDERPTGARSAR